MNIAGAEFSTEDPTFSCQRLGEHGIDYIYPSRDTVRYFSEMGFKQLRLPFRWERLQPSLNGALNSAELARLTQFLDTAARFGGQVVLDLHNYGRYKTGEPSAPEGRIVGLATGRGTAVTAEHLVNLWCRVSGVVRHHTALKAYGLMNEPHDMQGADWKATSQRVVQALRSLGDRTDIYVSGDGWSHAHDWVAHNGPTAWIIDPLGRVFYEAHCYFDRDASGSYRASFAAELQADPSASRRGVERLLPFVEWCARNKVRGVIGEYGVPREDPGWQPALRSFLRLADESGITTYCWAGGEWWGDHPLSVQPEHDQHAPQMSVINGR